MGLRKKKFRNKPMTKHQPIKTETGQLTQNKTEEIQRWTQWLKQQLCKPDTHLALEIEHIKEEQWTQQEHNIQNKTPSQIQTTPELQLIRKHAELTQLTTEHKNIDTWLNADYTTSEIRRSIKQLKNQKSHGSDGIPGEVYKILQPRIAKYICQILNKIKHGNKLIGQKYQAHG